MAFRVEVAPQALADLDAIAGYIKLHGGVDQSRKWFNGMIEAIASLKAMPLRCPIAGESDALGQEVRLLLHGRSMRMYKVFFSVQQITPETGTVRGFHVRHWAHGEVGADELSELVEGIGE